MKTTFLFGLLSHEDLSLSVGRLRWTLYQHENLHIEPKLSIRFLIKILKVQTWPEYSVEWAMNVTEVLSGIAKYNIRHTYPPMLDGNNIKLFQ